MRLLVVLAASALVLTACGGSSDDDGEGSTSGTTSDGAGPATVELVDSGFGQNNVYVQGIAVVTSTDERAVGEFVTVSMNFLDAAGEIIGTSDQVESYAWPGQELVLPVWFDVSAKPGVEVANVDASVSISDHGMTNDEVEPLAAVTSTEIRPGVYGGYTAVFDLQNPTTTDLTSPRVGIVCYDQEDKIIGGKGEFPNLIAAGKSILLESDVTTSGMPARCVAHTSYGL